MAARIESEALLQHELASVAVRVEELSNRGAVDGEGLTPDLLVVQPALTKDGIHEMRQEVFRLAEQQIRLEGGLAGLEDLRMKVDRIRAELDSPLEEY